MAWTKLDDGFMDNPKLIEAMDSFGDSAFALWVGGVAYCNKHLTDGFIKRAVVPRLTRHDSPHDVAAALVASGCWDAVEGGYQVHDFLDHNPSKEDVMASREAARRRQSESRDRRATPPASHRDLSQVTPASQRDGGVNHDMVTGPSQPPIRSGSDPDPIQRDSRSQPTVAPRARAHEDPPPGEPTGIPPAEPFALAPLDSEPSKAEPKRQRRSAIRDDFAPSESNRAFAAERGFSAATLERERQRFVNYWKSRGEPRADWCAGFRNWLDRAEPSGGPTNGRPPNPTPVNAMQNTGYAPGTKLATPETSL